MKYYLAQLNIGEFLEDVNHPNNKDFVENLDKVNTIAEQSEGFVWRLKGDGNSAIDIRPFNDPKIAVNMSLWESKQHLIDFVYGNSVHTSFMKRRREWFKKMKLYSVLWWIPQDLIPTIEEAKHRLKFLSDHGPTPYAFTFAKSFPADEWAEVSTQFST